MHQNYLKISKAQPITLAKTTTNKSQAPKENTQIHPQFSAKVPLSSYIANNNIHFGKQIEKPEKFDISILPIVTIDDEFAHDECIGSYNISCITSLASQFMTEQIRHIQQTGEIIGYKKENIINENRGCTQEELQQKLDEAKEEFVDYFNEEAQKATEEIDKVSPTRTEHTVYRIVNNLTEESEKYFDKINSLQKDDEVILDSAPIYVGTNPIGLLKTYGTVHDGVLFKIELPKGSKLAKFPSYDGINQLLMKPNSKFKVIDNKEFQDNFRVIGLEYMVE